MDAISNPAHARRGDRRRTRRQVDDAFARGVITAADRATRMAHVDAATTKGDLAMIVRDLTDRQATRTPHGGPGGGSRAGRPHPQTSAGHRPGGTHPGLAGTTVNGPALGRSGPSTAVMVGGVVAAMALVGVFVVGVLAFFVVSSSDDRAASPRATVATPSVSPSTQVIDTLLTQSSWDRMLGSLQASSGDTEVYGLDAYQYSATARVPVGSEYAFESYSDGDWTRSSSGTLTPYDEEVFDLSTLAPDFLDKVTASVAEQSRVSSDQVTLLAVRVSGKTQDSVTVRYTDQQSFRTSEDEFDLDGVRIS